MASSLDPANVAAVFKAYDVRGTVPDQIDDDLARATGRAFVQVLGRTSGPVERIVIGHDMRPSSPALARAYAEGANEAGADVVMIGLCSTDQLYFASGHLGLPGVMFTASHNPARYNGIKQCRGHAAPVGMESGLAEIRDQVLAGRAPEQRGSGTVEELDTLGAYVDHLLALAPVSGRPLRVVVDAGNGMAGHTAPAVFAKLSDVDLVPLYFDLDGTFPNHEANPMDPANLTDLQAAVIAHHADIGLAFDGDADRCFFVAETGERVAPSDVVGLIATRELARHPGAAIIYNAITSRAVPEEITEHGGRPIRTRVGHSFIKQVMADNNAVFGGEHSGHYYFRDFWNADSGMLAALHVLQALGQTTEPLSTLMSEFSRYIASGETNLTVADIPGALARVEAAYSARGATADHLDGLTVTLPSGPWFNLRPSNTEPLLRLNVEAADQATMTQLRNEVLHLLGRTS